MELYLSVCQGLADADDLVSQWSTMSGPGLPIQDADAGDQHKDDEGAHDADDGEGGLHVRN